MPRRALYVVAVLAFAFVACVVAAKVAREGVGEPKPPEILRDHHGR